MLTIDSDGNALSQDEAVRSNKSWNLADGVDLKVLCRNWETNSHEIDLEVVDLRNNAERDCSRISLLQCQYDFTRKRKSVTKLHANSSTIDEVLQVTAEFYERGVYYLDTVEFTEHHLEYLKTEKCTKCKKSGF